jgi:hypothetical protein
MCSLQASLLLAVLGLNLAAGAAPPAPVSWPSKKVSLHVHGAAFRQVIEELFRGTDEGYVLHPDVANVPVTIDVENVDFRTAFKTLLAHAGALYRIEGPTGATGHVWVIGKDDRMLRELDTPRPEPIAARLEPTTAVLEIVVPAAMKKQVKVSSESATSKSTSGELQTSGNVLICFPNGMCLKIQQAQVKVIDAGADSQRRILITPLAAPTGRK